MALGLESGTVRVVEYNPGWPDLFAKEAERIRAVVDASHLSVTLEHTGSTSIQGLAAKPIIDILAGYPDGAIVHDYIEALQAAGYTHRGEQGIPGREFFRRGDPRSYHVHMVLIGSPFWNDHLLFRDRLRADASLRDAYGALKLDLAKRYPRDREAYIDAKGPFVADVLLAARKSLRT
ncbi:MAG TPA: GrpB family protein [Gemmatimonadaceae bacterium]|nr:GrpB family protein [Gemmatimonadaceae bacterium]